MRGNDNKIKYEAYNLDFFISADGEGLKSVNNILSTFSSKFDDDIAVFLQEKAIDFSKKNLAKTYLVFYYVKEEVHLNML